MADALCGPSNALQNLQKHSSVDRTLQQDRLLSRQSPQQSFRSGPSQHSGAIDPEFEAFQAGYPPPQPEAFHRFPAHHAPPPGVAGPAALPDWAADFQRMHVSSPPPPPMQHQSPVQPQHTHTASWHQDFMRQQSQSAPSVSQLTTGPSMPIYAAGPTMGYGAGHFAHQQPFVAQRDLNAGVKQQEPAFDDAAFASAFDAAAAEMLQAEPETLTGPEEVQAEAKADPQYVRQAEFQIPQRSKWEEMLGMYLPPEHDPVLAFMKEHAFNEYCRHQILEYLPRSGVRDPASIPNCSLASLYLGVMEKLAARGFPGLAPDDKFGAVLNRIRGSEGVLYEEQFMFKARAERLYQLIQSKCPHYLDRASASKARDGEDHRLREMRLHLAHVSQRDDDTWSAADRQQLEEAKFNQLVAEVGTESPFFPVEASRTITARDIRSTIRSEQSHLNERPEELLRNMNPPNPNLYFYTNLLQQPIEDYRQQLLQQQRRRRQQQQQQQQQQPQQTPLNNDDAELARTAGQLVESVSHDTSQKFAQSKFLALMRQLRDHEVRVDGDKIVETATPTIPANQQDLDLGRNGSEDNNRTMTGALQTDGNDGNDAGELRT